MDEFFMRRAIELAKKGEGWCHPNPLVGAVIVKNGKIIAEGYHAKYGDLHAERNALKNAKESVEGGTLYCTLEPCCHTGKQPPCTEAIIAAGIKKVYIGSFDPNPLVAGKGTQILKAAGIEVIEGFLKDECDTLNDIFFHYITEKKPYVIMKYAMTADGKIATETGKSKWITGEAARLEVQRLRHKCMGIMAGIGTVEADDPLLNCRLENGRSPVRIITDSSLKISEESQIIKTADKYRTIIATVSDDINKAKKLEDHGTEVWKIIGKNGRVDLQELMTRLGQEKIDSVLLEGGAILNSSALKAGIVNEIDLFMAPKLFGGKGRSPVEGSGADDPSEAYKFRFYDQKLVGEDILIRYKALGGNTCSQG
ncbi:MAG: bifunctional diaminohydroxyphosphoribosylaminopyrimidine deaminase/5-amino-6-(5-phosphoribosylamino)uracil reductase RibD [Lachnospiraceae bacterium]|nr:bifunctional diaminohydroxyphosphoribosylaminopyrimidine deaminase/5-amino-6-(5-phosphoribosylamino)uracil reductase RibD [Lachnospiraceae bacterium]